MSTHEVDCAHCHQTETPQCPVIMWLKHYSLTTWTSAHLCCMYISSYTRLGCCCLMPHTVWVCVSNWHFQLPHTAWECVYVLAGVLGAGQEVSPEEALSLCQLAHLLLQVHQGQPPCPTPPIPLSECCLACWYLSLVVLRITAAAVTGCSMMLSPGLLWSCFKANATLSIHVGQSNATALSSLSSVTLQLLYLNDG